MTDGKEPKANSQEPNEGEKVESKAVEQSQGDEQENSRAVELSQGDEGALGAGRTQSCTTSDGPAPAPTKSDAGALLDREMAKCDPPDPRSSGDLLLPREKQYNMDASKELQRRLSERLAREIKVRENLEESLKRVKAERDSVIDELHEIDKVFEELDKPLHKNDTRPMKITNLYAIIKGYANLVTTHEETIAGLNMEINRLRGIG